jgi:transposase
MSEKMIAENATKPVTNPFDNCLYGYLNRIQSSRRLEREAQRNVELMWQG